MGGANGMATSLRGVDLNLLVILDALIDEAHVSRAAARLELSQPATSAALDRCRGLFNDPLLKRSNNGMRLTARAEALRVPLRDLLAGVSDVVGREEPDVATVSRTVSLLMADLLGAAVAPELYRRVAAAAPSIDLVFLPWGGGADALDFAARGRVDVLVSVLPGTQDASRFHIEDVRHERYVVAMRADHPAAQAFDLDRWLAWPHAITSSTGERHGALDDVLAALGRQRRIGVAVPSFLLVPDLLRLSDMIGMIPRLAFASGHCHGLVQFEPPVPVPGFTLKLAWHHCHDRDPAIKLVASTLRNIIRELGRDDAAVSMVTT